MRLSDSVPAQRPEIPPRLSSFSAHTDKHDGERTHPQPETDRIVSNAYYIFSDKMPQPKCSKCLAVPYCHWRGAVMVEGLRWRLGLCSPQIRADTPPHRLGFLFCNVFTGCNALPTPAPSTSLISVSTYFLRTSFTDSKLRDCSVVTRHQNDFRTASGAALKSEQLPATALTHY